MLRFVALALLVCSINAAPASKKQDSLKASSSQVVLSSLPQTSSWYGGSSGAVLSSAPTTYVSGASAGNLVLNQGAALAAPAGGVVYEGLSGAGLVGAAPAGGVVYEGLSGAGLVGAAPAISTGFAAAPAITTGFAAAPAAAAVLPGGVQNVYAEHAHVVPGQEIVYKVRSAPKVQKHIAVVGHVHKPATYVVEQPQYVVGQPQVEVQTQVLPQKQYQQVNYVQKPQQKFVKYNAPVVSTSTKYLLAVPEEPKPKVYYSERVRETEGSAEQKENHKITVHHTGEVNIAGFDEHFTNLGANIPSTNGDASYSSGSYSTGSNGASSFGGSNGASSFGGSAALDASAASSGAASAAASGAGQYNQYAQSNSAPAGFSSEDVQTQSRK